MLESGGDFKQFEVFVLLLFLARKHEKVATQRGANQFSGADEDLQQMHGERLLDDWWAQ